MPMFRATIVAVANGFILEINGHQFVIESMTSPKEGFEDLVDAIRVGYYRATGLDDHKGEYAVVRPISPHG